MVLFDFALSLSQLDSMRSVHGMVIAMIEMAIKRMRITNGN